MLKWGMLKWEDAQGGQWSKGRGLGCLAHTAAPSTPTLLPLSTVRARCLALPLITRGLEDVVLWKYEAVPMLSGTSKPPSEPLLFWDTVVLCSRLPPRHIPQPSEAPGAEEQARASQRSQVACPRWQSW